MNCEFMLGNKHFVIWVSSYPEVVRIYVELLGVQHTQFSISGFDVVHVLHGSVQAMQHDFTVSSNHGVSHDGSGIVQVSKVAEVPLGPRVNDKTSTSQNEEKEHQDVLNGGPLKFCPLNHVSDFRCSDKVP
uniref:Uncharacterized protein n=1 Tax=Sinocyclocheilus grahami TaxID=75366 RepID=A0A672MHB5_SINGR